MGSCCGKQEKQRKLYDDYMIDNIDNEYNEYDDYILNLRPNISYYIPPRLQF